MSGTNINVFVVSGNLTEDGQIKVLPGGDAVLKFRIACNESWKKTDGTRQERVDFFSAELWGKRAEALAKHLTKGSGVIVQGRLRMERVGEGNASRYFTTLRVSELSFSGGGGESRQRSTLPTEPDNREAVPVQTDDGDDQIPF